jgi:hypothetical protein
LIDADDDKIILSPPPTEPVGDHPNARHGLASVDASGKRGGSHDFAVWQDKVGGPCSGRCATVRMTAVRPLPLIEWFGRGPTLPARGAQRGVTKEHRRVEHINRDRCHDGHRYLARIRSSSSPSIDAVRSYCGRVVTRPDRSAACQHAAVLIGMEACIGARYLSHKLQAPGHDARLMPAKYLRECALGGDDYGQRVTVAEAER